MVESPSYIGEIKRFRDDLTSATQELEALHRHLPQALSKEELDELNHILKHLNETLKPSSMEKKSVAFEAMSEKIGKVLLAIQLFHNQNPQISEANRRNVEQAIVSLASSLSSALGKPDKNLRDLKKHRIGRRIEKVQEAKRTKEETF